MGGGRPAILHDVDLWNGGAWGLWPGSACLWACCRVLANCWLFFLFFVEGSWDRVHQVIGQAHTLLHQQGVVRIQTDIRVGSR